MLSSRVREAANVRVGVRDLSEAEPIRMVADDQGNYVEVSDSAVEALGYTREELLGMSVWDLTPSSRELDGLALWQDFIRAGEQHGEYVLRNKQGYLLRFRYRARANVQPGRHESLLTPFDEPS